MYVIECLSEDCLQLRFEEHELERVSALIQAIETFLRTQYASALRDVIPAYASLTIQLRFPQCLPQHLVEPLKTFIDGFEQNQEARASRHIQLPCYYGGEFAPDLDHVATHCGLSRTDVVALHTQTPYRVYAIGFAPGFPYLGFTSAALEIGRRAEPRTQVAAGSVGLAGRQTGIYPCSSPGGWQIIGNCPVAMFQPKSRSVASLCPLRVGDTVHFYAIDRDEYLHLKAQHHAVAS